MRFLHTVSFTATPGIHVRTFPYGKIVGVHSAQAPAEVIQLLIETHPADLTMEQRIMIVDTKPSGSSGITDEFVFVGSTTLIRKDPWGHNVYDTYAVYREEGF